MADKQDPKEIDLKTMDRRVAVRLVRRGLVSEKDLEKAHKQLPDLADKAVPVSTQLDDLDEG